MKGLRYDMKSTGSRPKRKRTNNVLVDLVSLQSIDHACDGCGADEPCCCSSYEVCVSAAELEQIIQVLPEAARFCPHLRTGAGYDNVFDEVEPGLFALDTNEDGICVLAFLSSGKLRCSLHAAASLLGLPLGTVKPKACLLWPMSFSGGAEVLSLAGDALSFRCNSRKGKRSRSLNPAFVEAIEVVYGEGLGKQAERESVQGARRTTLVRRC